MVDKHMSMDSRGGQNNTLTVVGESVLAVNFKVIKVNQRSVGVTDAKRRKELMCSCLHQGSFQVLQRSRAARRLEMSMGGWRTYLLCLVRTPLLLEYPHFL